MKFKIKYTVEDVVEFTNSEIQEMLDNNGKVLGECQQWEVLEAIKDYVEMPSTFSPDRYTTVTEISFTK